MSNEASSFSLSQCYTSPRPSSLSASAERASASIKRSLMLDKIHFRVKNNLSKRATAACWKVFGLSDMSTEENSTKNETLHGFASCKTCFDAYIYIELSTWNSSGHRCFRDLSPDQSSGALFLQPPRSAVGSR